MPTYAFAAPIAPGKLPVMKEMASLLMGDRLSETREHRRRAGINREQVFIQHTPMGDMAVIVYDTSDRKAAMRSFAIDSSDLDTWFRDKVEVIHGLTLEQMSQGPTPDVVLDWKASGWHFDEFEGSAMCFPIAHGKTSVAQQWIAELAPGGAHHDEYVRTQGELGIKRQLFCVMSTPDGDMMVMFGEGLDGWFPKAYKVNATSQTPFYVWFRETIASFADAPVLTTPTALSVESILHLTINVPARV